VSGGIPNGGYIGEILAITIYGFNGTGFTGSYDCGTLVDPMATLLNANGDVVSAMLITSISEEKKMFTNAVTA
jgi:hypothetical protein